MSHPVHGTSADSPAPLLISACRLMLYLRNEVFDSTREFYRNVLGFRINHEWDSEDGRGVMFDCGACIIELIDPAPGRDIPASVGVSLRTPDVNGLWRRLSPVCPSATPLNIRDWGDTDFELRDPGGFRVVFFSPTDPTKKE
jgi:catechol 2,3-dioxygenase-like lactoylglutathione lyase family enzyme